MTILVAGASTPIKWFFSSCSTPGTRWHSDSCSSNQWISLKINLHFNLKPFLTRSKKILYFKRTLSDQVTYEEMQSETMIPDRELTRALQVFSFNGLCLTLPMCQFIEFNMPLLQPLSVGKSSQRILVKSPKSKEIEPSHTFSINEVGNTYYCFVSSGYRNIC